MPRPANSSFTDASVTEGGFKSAHDSLNDWLGLMLGSLDTHVDIAGGAETGRPSATAGGWLRWNTTSSELDISIGTTWRKLVWSVIDATWHFSSLATTTTVALFKSSNAGNVATVRIQNNATDFVEVERQAAQTIVRCSGTDPVKIMINSVAVFSIDSSGNVIAAGNISANGTP